MANLLGRVLNVIGGGFDSSGREGHVALEGASSFANVTCKPSDEVGSGQLLLARLALNMVHRAGSHVLDGIGRFLKRVARNIARCLYGGAGTLLHLASSGCRLILQLLRRAEIPVLGEIRFVG